MNIYNHIDYTYEDRIENEIFTKGIEKIVTNLIKKGNVDENSNTILIGPNIFLSNLISSLRNWTVDSYGYHRPDNSYDKSRKDIQKYNKIFIYFFCEFDAIYEPKNDKLDICLYEQVMEGYKKFFDALMKAPKNNQFKKIRYYYGSILKNFQPLGDKYVEFKSAKSALERKKQRKDYFDIKETKFQKVHSELIGIYDENRRMKEFLENYRDKIISNPRYLIPYSKVPLETKWDTGYNYKTNVCIICRFNCHTKCSNIIKNLCRAFDFKFNCKICPNKCPASQHTIAKVEFPNYEYKTIDEMYPNSPSNIEDKIKYVIENLEKENEELDKKIRDVSIDLNAMKDLVKISNSETDNLKNLNRELNRKIEGFNLNYLSEFKYDGKLEEEIFKLFIFSFLNIKYIYEYTD